MAALLLRVGCPAYLERAARLKKFKLSTAAPLGAYTQAYCSLAFDDLRSLANKVLPQTSKRWPRQADASALVAPNEDGSRDKDAVAKALAGLLETARRQLFEDILVRPVRGLRDGTLSGFRFNGVGGTWHGDCIPPTRPLPNRPTARARAHASFRGALQSINQFLVHVCRAGVRMRELSTSFVQVLYPGWQGRHGAEAKGSRQGHSGAFLASSTSHQGSCCCCGRCGWPCCTGTIEGVSPHALGPDRAHGQLGGGSHGADL